MDSRLQQELNDVIKLVQQLPIEIRRTAKQDMNEAAQVLVSAVQGRTPVSIAPHTAAGKRVSSGNLRKSIRRLALRRVRNAAVVGPKFGGANDGFYAGFVERGTRYQRAQRFIESAAESAGPVAQRIALDLTIKRLNDFEKRYFK